jgi:hypothetical protein
MNKNIIDLYKNINEFKKGYKLIINFMKGEILTINLMDKI